MSAAVAASRTGAFDLQDHRSFSSLVYLWPTGRQASQPAERYDGRNKISPPASPPEPLKYSRRVESDYMGRSMRPVAGRVSTFVAVVWKMHSAPGTDYPVKNDRIVFDDCCPSIAISCANTSTHKQPVAQSHYPKSERKFQCCKMIITSQ